MSHNGEATPDHEKGTMGAFTTAYKKGYRWFQVDAVARDNELVSYHTVFGRAYAFRRTTKQRLAAAEPLDKLLRDPSLAGSRWNIEVKSKTTSTALLALLNDMTADELEKIMISSPVRTVVLKRVAAKFPTVAIAAPVWHGGVFGVRFLTSRFARIDGREYDCQQVFHWFVGRRKPDDTGPIRQAWTIRTQKRMHTMLGRNASVIVDSKRLVLPWRDQHARRTYEKEKAMPDVQALSLGGGGWRAAFGSIGAIMYFQRRGDWNGIREIVGTSGGAFAVAALAAEGPGGGDEEDPDPTPRLTNLVAELKEAGLRGADVAGLAGIFAALLLAIVAALAALAWNRHSLILAGLAAVVLAATPFLARLIVGWRSRRVIEKVFHTAGHKPRFRSNDTVGPPAHGEHRYRIGAAGLNDGNLYTFTTHPEHDFRRWDRNERAPRPLEWAPDPSEGRPLISSAVVRSSSLPGLAQLGWRTLNLRRHTNDPIQQRPDEVPDRLVDSGISSIFGRRLVEERIPTVEPAPALVVVDAGRALVVQRRAAADRARHILERFSALYHLARWLKVSFDASYQQELARVADDELSDGFRCRLVRLAEPEIVQPRIDANSERKMTQQRQDDLNRLVLLRDRVHRLNLIGVKDRDAHRAIAAAVAACALEFEENPDVPATLHCIGHRLGLGNALFTEWADMPLMGSPAAQNVPIEALITAPDPNGCAPLAARCVHEPCVTDVVELEPVQMGRAEALDKVGG